MGLRHVAAVTILICMFGYSGCSGGSFLDRKATLDVVLQERNRLRRSLDVSDLGDVSAESLDTATLLEMLKTAVDMFRAMNSSKQDKVEEGAKTLAIFLETAHQALENNGQTKRCNQCLVLARFLKLATLHYTWDQVGPVAYNICVIFAPKVDPSLDELPDDPETLCNIVWIQGPHVYDIAKDLGITSLVQCEYVNWCLPEPTDDNTLYTGGKTLPPSLLSKLPTLPFGITVPKPIFPLPTGLPTGLPKFGKFGQGSYTRKRRSSGRTPGSRRRRSLENAMRVAYLTDVHFDLHYQEDTNTDCGLPVCCTKGQGAGNSGPWGDYHCNTPYRTYQLFLNKIKELDVDFLIYGGDNPPHKLWTDTLWGQFNCTYALISGLQETLPGVPAYPNLGNHETYPTNLYYTELNATKELNQLFSQWWQPLSDFDSGNMDTLNTWFYFAKEIKPKLILLSFNSLFMYTQNYYISIINSKLQDNYVLEMQQFMVQTMEDAKANGNKVILVGHVPPGNGATVPGRWLTNFLIEYGDLIVLYLAGHTHQDDFRVVYDFSTMEPRAVSQIAPSLTCKSDHNPGMRIYYLDPDTYEALDYDQYLLDLTAALNSPDPAINMSYRASEEYDLPDLSAQSFADLAMRMNEDPTLFNTFVQNFYTLVNVNGDTCSSDSCRNSWMCRITNSNYDQQQYCVQESYFNPKPTTTTAAPICNVGGASGVHRDIRLVYSLAVFCLMAAGFNL